MKPSKVSIAEHQRFLLRARRSVKGIAEEIAFDTRPRTEASQALAKDVAEYIARGGKVQQLAPGASVYHTH
jgi:hypothetical protein